MEKAILFFSAAVLAVHAASLPPEILTCKKSDKTCLLKAVKDGTKFLAKGNKNLGLPSIDPVHVPKIHIPGNGGSVDIDQTYTDLYIHGLTDSEYTDVTVDLDDDNCNIHLEQTAPHVKMIGGFKVIGKLLLFTLGGEGPANITIVNLKLKFDFPCKKRVEKENTYLDIVDASIDLNPEKCIFDIKNLVDGNEALSANILNVMNDNHMEIFMELKADYENVVKAVFKSLAATFFKKIPLDEIFH